MCNTFCRSYNSHIPILHLTVSAAQRECVRPIALGFRWMNSGIYISNSYVLEKKTQINYVGISKRSNHFQRVH